MQYAWRAKLIYQYRVQTKQRRFISMLLLECSTDNGRALQRGKYRWNAEQLGATDMSRVPTVDISYKNLYLRNVFHVWVLAAKLRRCTEEIVQMDQDTGLADVNNYSWLDRVMINQVRYIPQDDRESANISSRDSTALIIFTIFENSSRYHN